MRAEHSIPGDLLRESLCVSGYVNLRAAGWSMVPTIWPGDGLAVKPVDYDKLLPGTILVFQRGRDVVAHRIVSSRKGVSGELQIVTRGDALHRTDAPLSAPELLGMVEFITRNGKPVPLSAQTLMPNISFIRRFALLPRCAAKLWQLWQNLQPHSSPSCFQ